MSARVDTTDFNKALKRWQKETGKHGAEAINKKAFFVVKRAQDLTPKADKTAIEVSLGATARKVSKSRKTGALKAGARVYKDGALVFRMIQAQRKREGQPGLSGSEMRKEANRIISARTRSIATLKRGWNEAKRKLARASKLSAMPVKGQRVKGRSMAYPASAKQQTISAKIIYRLRNSENRIDRRVRLALQKGFAAEALDMVRYLNKKLQEGANKVQRGAR